MDKYDLVVIGGGPGGYPAAIRGAQLGARVALIEREQLGGTCLNWGCIPTKTLIAATSLYAGLCHAERLGVKAEGATLDYAALCAHKNKVVEQLRGGIGQLLKAHGVTVYQGTGAFLERNRIAVRKDQTESARLESARTIIASGSTAAVPSFLPTGPSVVENRAFLDLDRLPPTLAIMGGGIIGCELACMAAQAGASVTIVEMLDDILMVIDPDVRAEARRHMQDDLKIRILTGRPLADVKTGKSGIKAKVGDETVEADKLLVAVGRRPVTDGLALDKAGLAPNEKGFIAVDAFSQTRAASVYAIGDVNGGPQLAHAATAQGVAAAESAVAGKCCAATALVPNCIFTAPEIGTVGLSEQEAARQKRAVAIGKFPFAALGKAVAAGETAGFVKWIADAETDQLLGAQAVGLHATELISEATIAIQAEWTAAELGRAIHAHPTLSEAWMEAAHAVHSRCIHAPPRRKSGKK